MKLLKNNLCFLQKPNQIFYFSYLKPSFNNSSFHSLLKVVNQSKGKLTKNYNQNVFLTKRFSSVYVNHRDTEDNNDKAPFDFTEENYKQVDVILVSQFYFTL